MDQTLITNLRVRLQDGIPIHGRLARGGRGLDPLAARLRLSSLLNTLELRASSLEPSAVLCIRRMQDPLPGGLSLEAGERVPRAWELAMQQALDRLARGAVRAAHQPVPAGANAVLFADRAELLACLAADWCRGEMLDHWWWQSWLARGDLAWSVLEAWREAPEYVPGALQHLAGLSRSSGQSQASPAMFVRKIGPEASQDLLEGVLRRFGLTELGAVLSGPGRPDAPWVTGKAESQTALPYPPFEVRWRSGNRRKPRSGKSQCAAGGPGSIRTILCPRPDCRLSRRGDPWRRNLMPGAPAWGARSRRCWGSAWRW